MASAWKGISFFVFVAVAVLIIGGILHIVGLVTPNWMEISMTNQFNRNLLSGHKGLWVACALTGLDTFDCTSHGEVEGFLVATRLFEVLAILLGAVAIILTGLWAFLKIERYRAILVASSIIVAFVAGGCAIVGVIIYGSHVADNKRTSTLSTVTEINIGYSLIMCIISGIFCVIGAVLLLVGSRFK